MASFSDRLAALPPLRRGLATGALLFVFAGLFAPDTMHLARLCFAAAVGMMWADMLDAATLHGRPDPRTAGFWIAASAYGGPFGAWMAIVTAEPEGFVPIALTSGTLFGLAMAAFATRRIAQEDRARVTARLAPDQGTLGRAGSWLQALALPAAALLVLAVQAVLPLTPGSEAWVLWTVCFVGTIAPNVRYADPWQAVPRFAGLGLLLLGLLAF
ncbi:MAG: hypothetical protein ACU0BF_09930 [Paracoccaceae bacterium]